MVSHKCASWSTFGQKVSGIDVPYLKVKDKIQSDKIAATKLSIPFDRQQTFDVNQIRFRDANDRNVKYYNIDGAILSKISNSKQREEAVVVKMNVPDSLDLTNLENIEIFKEAIKSKLGKDLISVQILD